MVRLAVFATLQYVHRQYWFTSTGRPIFTKLRPNFKVVPRTHARNQSFVTSSSRAMAEFSYAGPGTLDDVITRSKNSSDIQTIAHMLPDIPRIPSRKRTFHLTNENLETHVRPLLLSHWYVGQVGGGMGDFKVLSLNKLFNFKNFPSAVEFFDALANIQDEENHHARVTVDYSNVHVTSHTHMAYQCDSGTDVDAKPARVPGLTSRDIRFAVKVETLHETFLADGRAVTKIPVDSVSLQTWSMEQLQRRYPAHVA